MCGRYFIDLDRDIEIKKVVEEIQDRLKDAPELQNMKSGESNKLCSSHYKGAT